MNLMPLPPDWTRRPFGIFKDPQLKKRFRWIALSSAIGVVSGVGAILFDLIFKVAQHLLLEGVGHFRPPASGSEGGAGYPPEHVWLLPISLLIGGLLSGALVFWFAPEAEGHGTDAVIRAFHHLRGRIRRRVPAIKALSSAITIGSGGSAGREGPIAQIGAGFGSFLADTLKLGDAERRILMMAGVAGGIGSIFRAPLGAALFAAEVLYSEPEFEYLVLLPGLISAIVGYSIYSMYAGWGVLFHVPDLTFHDPRQLAVYVLLGVVCGLCGFIYPRIFYGVRDRIFRPLPLPAWLKPAVGALALGGIAMAFPPALGMGYGYVQQAIDGQLALRFLVTFALVKIVATSFTISSGGSGGVFGPSLVIGGALGAAFGQAMQHWAPGLAPPPAACIMVAMGGFFAGVAKVPFASVIMVMEMTGSYGLLVPSLVTATIAYLFLPITTSLYENQLPTRGDSPAHLGAFALDVFRQARIRDYWKPATARLVMLDERASAAQMAAAISSGEQELIPVTDDQGRLRGEIAADEIRQALREVPGPLLIAWDLARRPSDALCPEDTLAAAARLLQNGGRDALVVVASGDSPRVLGLFTRHDLVAAYGSLAGASGEATRSGFS